MLERLREHSARARGGAYRAGVLAQPVSKEIEDWVSRAAPHVTAGG